VQRVFSESKDFTVKSAKVTAARSCVTLPILPCLVIYSAAQRLVESFYCGCYLFSVPRVSYDTSDRSVCTASIMFVRSRRRKNQKSHMAKYYDDEAMVAKEPLTPRSRWLQDVLELKVSKAENHVEATSAPPIATPQATMEQPMQNVSRNDDEVETFLQLGNEENARDGPPEHSDSIEERLQERVKCLKKKVSKSKTKKKSKSDKAPSSAPSTPAAGRRRKMSDSTDAQVVAAVMKVREGERNAKSSGEKSADPKARSPKRNFSPRRPVVVSDQHQQQVVEITPRVDKLSITTKECVLKAMTHQDPPGVETPHALPVVMARASSFGSSSSMAQMVATSLTTDTPNNVAKATKLRKKKEKKMSWLRKALSSMDTPRHGILEDIMTPRSVAPTVPTFEDTTYKPTETVTSPLQQQLWLSEFRKAQNEAKVAEELISAERGEPPLPTTPKVPEAYPALTPLARPAAQAPPHVDTSFGSSSFAYTPRSQQRSPSPTRSSRSPRHQNNRRSPSPRRKLSPSRRVAALEEELASPRFADTEELEQEQSLQLTKYYYEQREAAIVMDYSTFEDDAESVSSIEMLFNWFACKDPAANMRIDHRGKLVVATDSILSDNLTWEEEQKAKKRFSS